MRFLSCCCKKKSQREIVLLLVGLDNAGKTTAAKGLAKQDVYNVLPTAGFSTIKLRHRGFNVIIYDLGGGPQIREIWPRYFSDIHGVMFVIDASDMDRINESKQELKRLVLNDKISKKPILVLANKQDRPGALDEIDIIEKLSLEPLINAQKCPTRVEMCSFVNKDQPGAKMDPGLLSGYRWLLGLIIKQYKELNERVERDSLSDRKAREQTREAWRRKKGLIKDIPVQSPFHVSSPLENMDGHIMTINSVVDNHLPPIGKDENSSLDTIIQNGTVEVITHHHVPNPFIVIPGRPSSSNHTSHSPPPTAVSESSASSTLPVRKQLEHKSLVQRQKSFSAHTRRSKGGNTESEVLKLDTNLSPVFTLQPVNNVGMSVPVELSDEHLKAGNFIELPPVRPPGAPRPMTTRSLGRTGKAWDLHLPLEISVPGQPETMDKATNIF